MANTYTQILYHVVFSTKNRASVLRADNHDKLFRYIWGIHQKLNCHLYRINGVEDHVHILTSLHPTLVLADYMQKVKSGSSKWISDEDVFPGFEGWQDGYGAFTVSWKDRERVVDYIKRQQEHHAGVSFGDEYKGMLETEGVRYDEKYLL
jgi:REP element-mobilizing transposase RayT